MSSGSAKVIFIAMMANLGIALAKFAGAYFSRSSALLAEAIHSVVDTTNQVLLLVGEKSSKRKPDDLHPLWDTDAKPFSGRSSSQSFCFHWEDFSLFTKEFTNWRIPSR